ncbi:MAG: PaaI family thioesterase [Actinomycetes bacterium]
MTSWRAEDFDLLPRSVLDRWSSFGTWPDQTYFPNLVGVEVEELRRDYARMRLPWRAELNQPQGLMHGGAIATLIDTVVVPAIGTAYEEPRMFSTIEMSVRYLGPVRSEDLVAEGWVTRRGRRVVFCDVEVRTASAVKVATGSLIYVVGSPAEDAPPASTEGPGDS